MKYKLYQASFDVGNSVNNRLFFWTAVECLIFSPLGALTPDWPKVKHFFKFPQFWVMVIYAGADGAGRRSRAQSASVWTLNFEEYPIKLESWNWQNSLEGFGIPHSIHFCTKARSDEWMGIPDSKFQSLSFAWWMMINEATNGNSLHVLFFKIFVVLKSETLQFAVCYVI